MPKGSYFGRIQKFISIASKSAGGRFTTRSYNEFEIDSFVEKTIKPFLNELMKEIDTAFNIPEELKGFTVLDPASFPTDSADLENFGNEYLETLAAFCGKAFSTNGNVVPPILDRNALPLQYKAYKVFVIKDKLQWENKQQAALTKVQQQLHGEKHSRESLKAISSKRKLIQMDKNIKLLEKREADLLSKQDYTFEIMVKSWMESGLLLRHPDITKLLTLAALIPPSTAEVERSFSLMKLVCTRLRNRLLTETLSHCMHICKFQEFTEEDYQEILKKWLDADDTKTKKRKLSS